MLLANEGAGFAAVQDALDKPAMAAQQKSADLVVVTCGKFITQHALPEKS